jgi:DNA-binding response OmpR family regulator
VYGIVKQNRGYVWVKSAPGQGTTFELYFPRTEREASPLQVEAVTARRQVGTETVLLVEDMNSVRDVTAKILQDAGYQVMCAATPATAIELSRTYAERIHLLLSDVVLPGMKGDELSRRLVAERPGLRTLFMTGHAEDGPQLQGRIDGGTLLLTKPFKPLVLLDRVRTLLDATTTSRVA